MSDEEDLWSDEEDLCPLCGAYHPDEPLACESDRLAAEREERRVEMPRFCALPGGAVLQARNPRDELLVTLGRAVARLLEVVPGGINPYDSDDIGTRLKELCNEIEGGA